MRALTPIAAFLERYARHIADEGFGKATGVGVVSHQRRQRAAEPFDDELTVALLDLRETAQVVESSCPGFEPGA
jgi:hypothetical protein